MMHSRIAIRAVRTISLLAVAWCAVSGPVRAVENPTAAVTRFEIEPQPLASALNEFALQTHQQILFTPEVVQGRRTTGLKGWYTADVALSELLAASGLRSTRTANGTLLVTRPEAGAEPSGGASRGTGQETGPGTTASKPLLEQVVVTARRVEEGIQRVPIAISAYTPQALRRMDVRDLVTLNHSIPGVEVCCNVFNTDELIYIRGIQGSPTYFAGAPVSPQGYSNFFDVASVQVLKGPQGTLFGQASVAGAFVYEPRKPGISARGQLSVSAGSFGRRTIEGAFDLPLAAKGPYLRFAAVSSFREGYIRDLSNNRRYGDMDYYILRPSLRWQIGNRLESYTLLQYSQSRDSGQQSGMWVLSDINFNPSQPSLASLGPLLHGPDYYALAAQMLVLQERLGPYTILGTNSGCASTPFGPTLGPQRVTTLDTPLVACPQDWNTDTLLVNHTTYDISGRWSVKNILAYNRSSSFQSQTDGDLTPLILLDFGSPKNTHGIAGPERWSNELQLHGAVGRLTLTAGYFQNKVLSRPGLVYTGFATRESAADTRTENSSRAGYASLDVDLGHGFTLTAGARYNEDYLEQTSIAIDPDTNAIIGAAVVGAEPAGHIDYANLSYTIGLQYQRTPETLFFLTNARGYSAGGFQATPGLPSYRPQSLVNFEGGIKSTFAVGSMIGRLNASAYYGLFDDIQVAVWSTFRQPLTESQMVGFLKSNAARARIRGIDLDFTLVPSRLFEFSVALAYTRDQYTRWSGANPFSNELFDYSNTPFVATPEWKGNAHATLHVPVPGSWGSVELFAQYSARTKMAFIATPRTPTDPANPTTGLICSRQRNVANGYPSELADGRRAWVHCVEPQHNLDVGIEWRNLMNRENVALSLQGTNITGNRALANGVILDQVVGFSARQPAAPRMWFMTLRYDF